LQSLAFFAISVEDSRRRGGKMAKLTIKKRGRSWVLLEGRLGIDAFPTKARALYEKRWQQRAAAELRQLPHDKMAKTHEKFLASAI
jgi:hypothetical protein